MRIYPSHMNALCLMLVCALQIHSQVPTEPCGPAVRLSSAKAPPLIHYVTPDFATVARQAGVSGSVLFREIIGCDGHVQTVTFVSGPEALRQSTIDAVKQWVYRPSIIDGRPVAVDLTSGVSMRFGAGVLYEAMSPGRVRVSAGVMAGRVVSRPSPVLPSLPPDSKVSSATVLYALVDRDGRVIELTAVSGPEAIRESVLDAVRQWRYEPFLVDGHPVEVNTTIVLNISFGT